ncbi:MAG: 50S ribosome-binding GTPase [Isosphaeraceae bacterium]|nr:50S ribosome-binding GTPase [Isosphaeraceae bacterium]
MSDHARRLQIESALKSFLAAIEGPRALTFTEEQKQILRAGAERVRGQLLGPSEPVLTIVLAGGTGVGKSTLINALAGKTIAEASEIRPTTRHIQVYHHRDDDVGKWTDELAGEATFVSHERPELRQKLIVDAPDLDSFVTRHRATTRALLKRAGLVFYVFSPERYLEERTWSVLREETEFSASAAVLNKVDRLDSSGEVEQITGDLAARFAGIGLSGVRMFRICARAHVPRADGTLDGPPPLVDDMVALRAYIEHELQASEIARILRAQRALAVEHLRAELDGVVPPELLQRLDEVEKVLPGRTDAATSRLAEALRNPLAAVEAELAPTLNLRRHEPFWGPFRNWLAVTDFLGVGLTSLVRRYAGHLPADRAGLIERVLAQGSAYSVGDLLKGEAYALQDLLYGRGLPVARWRAITADADGTALLARVAAEVEAHFEMSAAGLPRWGRTLIQVVSVLGSVVVSGLVLIALFIMARDLFAGRYAGFALFWHGLAMIVLFFLALQGVVDLALPRGSQWLGVSAGPRAIRKAWEQLLANWLAAYRADVAADLTALHEPLAALEAALATSGPTEHSPTPAVRWDSPAGGSRLSLH